MSGQPTHIVAQTYGSPGPAEDFEAVAVVKVRCGRKWPYGVGKLDLNHGRICRNCERAKWWKDLA